MRPPRTPTEFAGASFEALLDPKGWDHQRQLLMHMGHERAGILGMACPTCFRGIPPDGLKGGPEQCSCEDVEMVSSADLITIHGLAELRRPAYSKYFDGVVI